MENQLHEPGVFASSGGLVMRTKAVCVVVCDTGLLASFGGWVCETMLLSSFGGAWRREPGLLAHVIHANVVLAVLSLDLPCHPRQRCARCVVVGLATASTSTLRSPCCRWACHDIRVDVALAMLSLGLPLHPWDIRIDVGLAGCCWALPESRGGKRG